MSRFIALFAALAVWTAAAPIASAQSPTTPAQAFERGRQIHDFDQAAWKSTDVLLKTLPKERLAEVRGWLVEADGDSQQVLYYGVRDGAPYGVFSSTVRKQTVTASREIKADETSALKPIQLRMIQARNVVIEAAPTLARCSKAGFNTVIVPPASVEAPVDVYVLTPQEGPGQYPVGGHYRFTVAIDGKILSQRAFTNSCLSQKAEPGAVGMVVSHLLDPTPTEIHAWLALWSGMPVYVAVAKPEQLWEVNGKGMRKVAKP